MTAKTRLPSGSEKTGATRTAPSLHWSAPDFLTAKTEDLVVEAPLAIEPRRTRRQTVWLA